MISAQGHGIDHDRVCVTFDLIVLIFLVEVILSDFIGLYECLGTLALVMISSSSRLM